MGVRPANLPIPYLLRRFGLLLALLLCLSALAAVPPPDWTAPQTPFHLAGNLYYVGSRDLAAFLLTTPAGNILINANLESSPPQIRASIEALGFRWADTRILLNSQAHFDHSAGTAAIARQTGAKVMVMDGDVAAMESGGKQDFVTFFRFPPAHVDRILHDGSTVTLGGTVLTARKTAGHTRGCTTWTFAVQEGGRVLHVVIIGGMAALDEYRLIDTPTQRASYPGIAADFLHTFAVLHTLPCDIFLGAHGIYFDLQGKLARTPADGASVWIDPQGYARAVAEGEREFRTRLAAAQAKAAGQAKAAAAARTASGQVPHPL